MAPQIKREPGRSDSDSESDDVLVPSSRSKRNTFLNSGRKKNQNKIGFNQSIRGDLAVKEEEKISPEHAPEASSSSEDIPTRKQRKPITPKSTKNSKRLNLLESESSSEDISTGKRTQRTTRNANKKSKKANLSGGSSQAGRRETRSSRRGRGRGGRNAPAGSGDGESEELEVTGMPSRAQGRNFDFGEPESSGDDALASSPGSIPKKGKEKKETKVYADEDESDDELPVSTKKRARKKAIEVYSDEEESDADMPVSSRKRKVPSASESDGEPATQRARRLSPSAVRQEQEDLAEDLEFLGSSPRKLDISRRPRSVPQPMNARQKALEVLKRRRAGGKDDTPEAEEEPQPRRRRALYDTETESEPEEDTDEDEDEIPDEPHAPVRQAITLDMFQEDDDDDNFVIEDDEETLGVPDEDARIPLAFSSMSRAKAKDLFKYAVEWMVQKKLNPGFARDDEIYRLTFRKLEDEVKGLAGSKFTSAAWTRDFTRALNARPILEAVEISGSSRILLENHCAACNRRSHPATWDVQFSGKAYRADTLSDVEEDSSDSDEEDDDDSDNSVDRRSVDANGHKLPHQDTVFHIGVFCKTNAETAHTLMHWRWHLYDWVKDYLKSQGHLDPAKIVERDGWKTKKKMKYANRVVDEMQENGEIKRLYDDFRATTKAAREAKVSLQHTRMNRDELWC